MKTLNEKLNESLLDDEEELVNNDNALIENFLNNNYKINGTYTFKNGVVDINGDIILINKKLEYLTDDLFSFGKVTGSFNINGCNNLKSLKGGPKTIDNDFLCNECIKLKNFKYAPKYVGGKLQAKWCTNIKNLKGLSESCTYDLSNCFNLNSLVGLPLNHSYSLIISGCIKLKSLNGCYKELEFLDIESCKLDSFAGGPEYIAENLYMSHSVIKTLDGFPKYVKEIIAINAKLPITLKYFKEKFIPKNTNGCQNIKIKYFEY